MQRLHERKADRLTLGGLRANHRLEQKSAEVVLGWGYEPSERMEVSQTTEGPNVRRAKELGSL
jgi:hypothetical protein